MKVEINFCFSQCSGLSTTSRANADQSSHFVSFLQLKRSLSVGSVCGKMKCLNVNNSPQKTGTDSDLLNEYTRISASDTKMTSDNNDSVASFLLSPLLPSVEPIQAEDLNKSCMPEFREEPSFRTDEILSASEKVSFLGEISPIGSESNVNNTQSSSLTRNMKLLELESRVKLQRTEISELIVQEEPPMPNDESRLNFSMDKLQKTSNENVSTNSSTTVCANTNLTELLASPFGDGNDSENKENVPVNESLKDSEPRSSKSRSVSKPAWLPKAINRSVSPVRKSPLEKLKNLKVKPRSGKTTLAPINLNYETNDAGVVRASVKPVPIFVERFGIDGSAVNGSQDGAVNQLNLEQTLKLQSHNVTEVDAELREERGIQQDDMFKDVERQLSRIVPLSRPKFDPVKLLGYLSNVLEVVSLGELVTNGESKTVHHWMELDQGSRAEAKVQDVLKLFKDRVEMEKQLNNLKDKAVKGRFLEFERAGSNLDYIWFDKENVELVYNNSLKMKIKFNKPQMKTTQFTVTKLPGSSTYHSLYLEEACKIIIQPEYTIGYDLADVVKFVLSFLNSVLMPKELADDCS